jgi:oxalate decarboxylase/phosphoglucose isomerase-like protein (cupin superfamily)
MPGKQMKAVECAVVVLFAGLVVCFLTNTFLIDFLSKPQNFPDIPSEYLEESRDISHPHRFNFYHIDESRKYTWQHRTGQTLVDYPLPKSLNEANQAYPTYRDLFGILQNWNPDNANLPSIFTETLQHFDYSNITERDMAARYRDAELPFKVYNVPEFGKVSAKWSDKYLSEVLRKTRNTHVEKSDSNHFMYWTLRGSRKDQQDYKPPTEIVNDIGYDTWLMLAKDADKNGNLPTNKEHYYFMTNAPIGDRSKTFVARDLSVFSSGSKNFFITKPAANKGIQCRFGMRGIIAEAHYDSGRNMIAMLKGTKRYILVPPHECKHLELIKEKMHPSYRHSTLDWSDMKTASEHFRGVQAIDTIVREGEVLYVPSYWIHYIVSLNYSIQCNSRSGGPPRQEGWNETGKCAISG